MENRAAYYSAGEILAPWLKQVKRTEVSMGNKGSATDEREETSGGRMRPLPEENMVRVAGRLVKNAFVREAASGKMATFMLKVPRT